MTREQQHSTSGSSIFNYVNGFTYGWKSEERYGEYAEARGDNFPHPSARHRITVPYGGDRYNAPPEGVSVAGKTARRFAVLIHCVLFRQVYEVTAEDEAQETYVQRRDQLLKWSQL